MWVFLLEGRVPVCPKNWGRGGPHWPLCCSLGVRFSPGALTREAGMPKSVLLPQNLAGHLFHLHGNHKTIIAILSLSHVQLFVTPWTVAQQPPLSMGFSRQEYRSGLPCPLPGDLPNPGMEPRSPTLRAYSLPSEPPVSEVCVSGHLPSKYN